MTPLPAQHSAISVVKNASSNGAENGGTEVNEFQILANAIIDLAPRRKEKIQSNLIDAVKAELEVRT